MKLAIILSFIVAGIVGCGPSPDTDLKELSNDIIPEYEMSEAVMDEIGMREETREAIQEHNELRSKIDQKLLAEHLRRDFTADELRELEDIYRLEVMAKLQAKLRSDEFRVEAIRRNKALNESPHQNQSGDDNSE